MKFTYIILLVLFISCKTETKEQSVPALPAQNATETKTEEQSAPAIAAQNAVEDVTQKAKDTSSNRVKSSIRPFETVYINKMYTDTITFSAYNYDYDDALLLGNKDGKEVALIHRIPYEDRILFTPGDTLVITWQMTQVENAGDPGFYRFEEVLETVDKIADAPKPQETLYQNLIKSAIHQLNFEKKDIKESLIAIKTKPNAPEETIIVLPEIADEGEEYFDLHSHILVVNTRSGEIKQRYYESAKTNSWVSDAIALTDISIDTGQYYLTDDVRAFGVRIHYLGSSRVNPFESEHLTLFVPYHFDLIPVLQRYEVLSNRGEWDGMCYGEFISSKTTLHLKKSKTQGYYDMENTTVLIESQNYEDKNGDCQSSEETSSYKSILKFNGSTYRPEKY